MGAAAPGSGTGSPTAPETPTGDCPGGRFTKVTVGAVIAVGRGTTCFVRTTHRDGSIAWSATGVITLNGVQLTPSGGPIILDQSGSSLAVELPAGTTLGFGSFTWTLTGSVNLPVTTAAAAAHFVLPKLKGKFKIAGIDVAVSPGFELTTNDGGSATVSLELELPKVFSGAAGDDKGAASMTFEFHFLASNDKGVRFTFKTTARDAWLFGKVQLSNLSLGLDSGPPLTFEGVASLKFPGVDGTFTIAVGLSGEGVQAFPLVTQLDLQASELEKPIAEGVYLQRLGGGFTRCADDDNGGLLSANAGVSFGPKLTVPGFFDGEPASLDGNVTLSLCKPKSLAVSGTGSIVEVPIAAATAKYIWSQGRLELSGNLTLKGAGFELSAATDNAFFSMPSKMWNVHGTGEFKAPSWTGGVLDGKAEAVISTNGVAVCLGKPGQRFGFGKHWGEDFHPFDDDCDIGPYSAGNAAVDPVGAAGRQFRVPPSSRIELVTAHGIGGPPSVSLTGPAGRRFDTPADGSPLRTPDAFIGRDPTTATTYAILFAPAPGTWTIAPEPGAAAPTSVQVADGLPPARVNARVRRAHKRFALSWRLRRIPGQSVTFLEHGASTDRVLRTTSRAQGVLRFAAAPGPGGPRQIIALVAEHELPRSRLVVAHFTAPPPPRLRAVSGLRRHGASLTWRSQPAALRYSLLLRTPNGATLALVSRRAHVRVPAAMRSSKLRVSISALDATGSAGPLRTISLPHP